MSIGTIKMAGRSYAVPDESEFTFGDARSIRLATGLSWAEFWEQLSQGDMVAVAGLAYLVMKRERPDVEMAEIDAMRIIDFDFAEAEDKDEEASGGPLGSADVEGSSSEKILAASGSQPSRNGGG